MILFTIIIISGSQNNFLGSFLPPFKESGMLEKKKIQEKNNASTYFCVFRICFLYLSTLVNGEYKHISGVISIVLLKFS